MEIKVVTPSMREQSIVNAPGIISVVTAAEIRQFGAKNLQDILQRQLNVYPFGSTTFRDNVTAIRGGNNTHVDNHTLIMINSRPIRESAVGGLNNAIYTAFPVNMIEKIEIIRGPGSVLYGSNAFTGVINIITRKAEDYTSPSITTSYGSFDTKMVNGSVGYRGEEFSILTSVQVSQSDGWPFDGKDITGTFGSPKLRNDTQSLFIQSSYKDFTLNVSANTFDHLSLDTRNKFPLKDGYTKRNFIDLEYETNVSDSLILKTNLTYNNLDEHEFNADDYLAEISLAESLTSKLNMIFGIVIDQLNSSISPTNSVDTTWYSSYFQADYDYSENISLIGGAQYNKPEGIDGDISPRLGTTIKLNQNWYSKLLYSKAFRSPYAVETSISTPSIVGNPQLEPEIITTLDAQILYQGDNFNSSFTYYNSEQEKTITRVFSNGRLTFNNKGSVKYEGYELEAKSHSSDKWQWQSALSYQKGKDDKGNNDIGLVPHLAIKLGASYQWNDSMSLAIHDSYYSATSPTNVTITNPEPGSYHWLTANVRFDLDKLLDLSTKHEVELSVYAENLLDEDVFFPTLSPIPLNTYRMRSGKAIYVTLGFVF